MQIGFIVILIIAIFVAIFAIQNGTPVPVDLFFARYQMPLAVVMMICLILGAIIVLILGTTRQFKKRSEYKSKIKSVESEKSQFENNLKAIEAEKTKAVSDLKTMVEEKAKVVAELKSMEEEKENYKNKNLDLSAKIAKLEEEIKIKAEAEAMLNEEINCLKAEIENSHAEIITKESASLTNNENSEVES